MPSGKFRKPQFDPKVMRASQQLAEDMGCFSVAHVIELMCFGQTAWYTRKDPKVIDVEGRAVPDVKELTNGEEKDAKTDTESGAKS